MGGGDVGDEGTRGSGGGVGDLGKKVVGDRTNDGRVYRLFEVDKSVCSTVYGQGTHVCIRQECGVNHTRGRPLVGHGESVFVVAKDANSGFANPIIAKDKLDLAVVVDLRSAEHSLDKWVEIANTVDTAFGESGTKVELSDLEQIGRFRANYQDFRTPFKRAMTGNDDVESPKFPVYKRTLGSEEDDWMATSKDMMSNEDRIAALEKAFEALDTNLASTWKDVRDHARGQQGELEKLRMGLSAGEGRIDTLTASIGPRAEGLAHVVAAPTVWGSLALVFDELQQEIADLARRADGMPRAEVEELVRQYLKTATAGLTKEKYFKAREWQTDQAFMAVREHFERLEREVKEGRGYGTSFKPSTQVPQEVMRRLDVVERNVRDIMAKADE
mmetsp:Transcript_29777/g.49355  ORF Transcript_29777/g.49355 Transcript_29777/m.49355 type:complete len:387 (+) Transcript_29777:328-1488(+)